jgi:hypothetical protein
MKNKAVFVINYTISTLIRTLSILNWTLSKSNRTLGTCISMVYPYIRPQKILEGSSNFSLECSRKFQYICEGSQRFSMLKYTLNNFNVSCLIWKVSDLKWKVSSLV